MVRAVRSAQPPERTVEMAVDTPVLTSAALDEEITSSDVPVLVQVGAEWCPHCRIMAPLIRALALEHERRLRVFTVDADTEPDIVARFEILGLPTLLLFREGRLVKR